MGKKKSWDKLEDGKICRDPISSAKKSTCPCELEDSEEEPSCQVPLSFLAQIPKPFILTDPFAGSTPGPDAL